MKRPSSTTSLTFSVHCIATYHLIRPVNSSHKLLVVRQLQRTIDINLCTIYLAPFYAVCLDASAL